jgi:uncharacterized protein
LKIEINRISPEGEVLAQEFTPQELDLETELIRFGSKVSARAEISRISNAVCVHLSVSAAMKTSCSRCLEDFEIDFKKDTDLNFPVDKTQTLIDLDPEIREEIMLDYPVKPLCAPDCLGLCPKCGKNLNLGGCSCGPAKKKAF